MKIKTFAESCIVFSPALYSRCDSELEQYSRLIFNQTKIERISLIFKRGEGAVIRKDFSPDGSQREFVMELNDPKVPDLSLQGHFDDSPIVLRHLPFGIGQIAQERYWSGAVWMGSQASLLFWHIVAVGNYQSIMQQRRLEEYESSRFQQNLSGLLFYSVVALSMLDTIL